MRTGSRSSPTWLMPLVPVTSAGSPTTALVTVTGACSVAFVTSATAPNGARSPTTARSRRRHRLTAPDRREADEDRDHAGGHDDAPSGVHGQARRDGAAERDCADDWRRRHRCGWSLRRRTTPWCVASVRSQTLVPVAVIVVPLSPDACEAQPSRTLAWLAPPASGDRRSVHDRHAPPCMRGRRPPPGRPMRDRRTRSTVRVIGQPVRRVARGHARRPRQGASCRTSRPRTRSRAAPHMRS